MLWYVRTVWYPPLFNLTTPQKDLNSDSIRKSKSETNENEAQNPPHPVLRVATYVATGFQFALALRLSNLSEASRVLSFLILPFHRGFDPSLAFLAVGALSVGVFLYHFALGNERPRLGGKRSVPKGNKIDVKLLIGSAIFGVGWGLAGICRKHSISFIIELILITSPTQPVLLS
jgi:hypothetical protein